MHNLLRSLLLLALLLSGCGWNGTPTRSNDFTPLTSIEITAVSRTIANQTSTLLTAKGNYSGLFFRDITAQVAWSTAAPTVAAFVTASQPSRVSGLAPGTATLTATLNGVSATTQLTVSPASVTSLAITPATPAVTKGQSSQLGVQGTLSDGTTQELTFDVDWTSSAPNVATIGNAPGSKGLSQALLVGTTTITATFSFNGVSGTTLLTVTPATLQSITVSPSSLTLLSLSRAGFLAVGSYSDGTTADLTSQAAWSSSRSDIALVAAGGVKTLAPGTVVISAALGGVSGTSSIKVTGGNLTAITISPLNPRLVRDTTGRMTAIGSFSNGSSRDISGAVDWSVAAATIAAITTPGGNLALLKPTQVTAGAVITARSGAISTETGLTVIAPQLLSLAISPPSLELTSGSSSRFTTSALYSDGTSQDVTLDSDWSSNALLVATVGNSGLGKGKVNPVASGSATISADHGVLPSQTAVVTVNTRALRDLTVSGTASAIVGSQLKFTATASYTDGFSKDVTEDTVWSISSSSVAALADAVNQPGQVVLVDGGLATLTASFGGKSKDVPLTSQVP